MEKHLFFCDIDGTLLHGASGIRDEVKERAREFRRAGGLVTLCTGRSPRSTRWVAEEMDIDLPCILNDGAMLYDFRKDAVISGTTLPRPVIDRLPGVAEEFPGFSMQAYGDTRIYRLRSNPMFLERGVQEEIEPNESTFDEVSEDIFKIVMASPDREALSRCCDKHFHDDLCHYAFASRHFVEVVARGVGKDKAALALAEQLGVPVSRTFAAGDGGTDVPLLQRVPHAYIPETAATAVRAVGGTIIPAAVDGGMAVAFADALAAMRFKK